jgi:DNA-binding MarR family transcriptional regulator
MEEKNRSEKPSVWRNASIIYRYGQMYLARNLEEIGVGRGPSQVVPLIVKHPGISQDKLASIMNLDKGTIARAIWQLEDDGYVRREADENDARSNRVFPTEKLYRHAPFIEEVLRGWYDILFKGFSEEEKDGILAGLERMSQNAIKSLCKK